MKKVFKVALASVTSLAVLAQATLLPVWLNPQKAYAAEGDTHELIINEVMWMGTSATEEDEWFEIYNPTNEDIDINGWTINGVSNSGDGSYDIGSEKIVPANGYAVWVDSISASVIDSSKFNSLGTPKLYGYTNIQLGDGSGNCRPISIVDTDEQIVDSMGCNETSWFEGYSGLEYKSMERNLIIDDGSKASSWHSSVGFVNLKDEAKGYDNATPGVANEQLDPQAGNLELVSANIVDANNANIKVIASDFADTEIDDATLEYTFKLYKNGDELVQTKVQTGNEVTMQTSSWLKAEEYAVEVYATNLVGLNSETVDSAIMTLSNPFVPEIGLNEQLVGNDTVATISEISDFGLEGETFNYYYREVGIDAWSPSLGNINMVIIPDRTKQYEFAVTSVINQLESEKATIKDKLPTLDLTKVQMSQNKPGTNDTISGLAGAAAEADTVEVYGGSDHTLLATLTANGQGGFDAVNLLDNKYAKSLIRLTDQAGKISQLYSFDNDIVGPQKSTLRKVSSYCLTSCKTTLDWEDADSSTQSYRVVYGYDGNSTTTQEIMTKSATLDLEPGHSYNFYLIGYDEHGNSSPNSNTIQMTMVSGVESVATLVDDVVQVTTNAISGTLEEVRTVVPASNSIIAPKAQAADNSTTPTPTPESSEEAKKTDWPRIIITAVLLLVVAGSFYALSRSLGKNEEDNEEPIKPEEPAEEIEVAEVEEAVVIAPVATEVKKANKPAPAPFKKNKSKKKKRR